MSLNMFKNRKEGKPLIGKLYINRTDLQGNKLDKPYLSGYISVSDLRVDDKGQIRITCNINPDGESFRVTEANPPKNQAHGNRDHAPRTDGPVDLF